MCEDIRKKFRKYVNLRKVDTETTWKYNDSAEYSYAIGQILQVMYSILKGPYEAYCETKADYFDFVSAELEDPETVNSEMLNIYEDFGIARYFLKPECDNDLFNEAFSHVLLSEDDSIKPDKEMIRTGFFDELQLK